MHITLLTITPHACHSLTIIGCVVCGVALFTRRDEGTRCRHSPGFQSGSTRAIRDAPMRFSPTPPALEDRRNANVVLPGRLNAHT